MFRTLFGCFWQYLDSLLSDLYPANDNVVNTIRRSLTAVSIPNDHTTADILTLIRLTRAYQEDGFGGLTPPLVLGDLPVRPV